MSRKFLLDGPVLLLQTSAIRTVIETLSQNHVSPYPINGPLDLCFSTIEKLLRCFIGYVDYD